MDEGATPKKKRKVSHGEVKNTRGMTDRKLAALLHHTQQGVHTDSEIARMLGLDKSTVCKAKKRFASLFSEMPAVGAYRSVKADILEAAEIQALKTVNEGLKRSKTSVRDSTYAFKVLFDATRMEKGLSTKNITTTTQNFLEVTLNEFSPESKTVDVTPVEEGNS